MFSTSALYFLVAIYGESIERREAHGLQPVEGQENETAEPGHSEAKEAEGIHNETEESPQEHSEEHEALEHNTNDSEHLESGEKAGEGLHDESLENQRTVFEPPLALGAGVGYAAVGLWVILSKRNTKVPYVIGIVGSLILLGIYFASRTVGISNLGTEPFGVFDVSVAGFQIVI